MCDISLVDEIKFLERYNQHFQEFILRFERFKEIRCQYEKTRDQKLLTDFRCYIDMLIVQIRSFCLEKDSLNSKNYTVQNLLNRLSSEELANNINNFLNRPLYDACEGEYRNIKNAIKFVSDKYICHHDKLSREEFLEIDCIFKELASPYSKNNFDAIINEFLKYILEAQQKFMNRMLEISKES